MPVDVTLVGLQVEELLVLLAIVIIGPNVVLVDQDKVAQVS